VSDYIAAFWTRLMQELAQSSPLEVAVKIAAPLIVIGLSWLYRAFLFRWWTWAKDGFLSRWGSNQKLTRVREAIAEQGPGVWLTFKHNPHPPKSIDRLRNLGKLILTVANLKGGVGKTTLTANLAAFFANPLGDSRPTRRVLVIDLDYQGSCSSMLFAGTDWRPREHQVSHASELISGSLSLHGQIGQPVTDIIGARGISAFYDLASTENREMIRWLIGDEKTDIRYRLSNTLLSDAVLSSFDVILIDAPPRLTTASVQALCASTHVLIPTVLDPLSSDDPVGYFGQQLKTHHWLWPQLKVMGVVGTLTNRPQRGEEEPALKSAGDRLRAALEGSNGRLRYVEARNTHFEFPYECSIRKSTPVARAASHGVPYVVLGDNYQARTVRAMFDKFGQEVERRWQL
jgi:cellulose biosynthesis protein BcsQ